MRHLTRLRLDANDRPGNKGGTRPTRSGPGRRPGVKFRRSTPTAHGHRMSTARLAHRKRMGRVSIWTNAPVVLFAPMPNA
jgi:hypothetical protein